ncbi:MAG TPA: VOC family protein [Terracidiphilus sp.]
MFLSERFLMPESRSTVMPALRYRNAPGAIDWLCQVFGFERHAVYANPDGTVAHAELTLNGGMIMLGSAKEDEHAQRYRSPDDLNGVETRGVYIVVADADQVHARAVAAGATILRPLQNTDYGSREFAVKDPEGHSWSAGTYDPWAAHG